MTGDRVTRSSMSMTFALVDLNRRTENLLAVGTVASTDDAGQGLRLRLSGRLTGTVQYPGLVRRNFTAWFPMREGAQVLAACPSGDPNNAVIVQTLYTSGIARPASDSNTDIVKWNDGAEVSYNSGSGVMTLKAARIKIIGDVEIEGNLIATGSIIDSGGNTNHHSH